MVVVTVRTVGNTKVACRKDISSTRDRPGASSTMGTTRASTPRGNVMSRGVGRTNRRGMGASRKTSRQGAGTRVGGTISRIGGGTIGSRTVFNVRRTAGHIAVGVVSGSAGGMLGRVPPRGALSVVTGI